MSDDDASDVSSTAPTVVIDDYEEEDLILPDSRATTPDLNAIVPIEGRWHDLDTDPALFQGFEASLRNLRGSILVTARFTLPNLISVVDEIVGAPAGGRLLFRYAVRFEVPGAKAVVRQIIDSAPQGMFTILRGGGVYSGEVLSRMVALDRNPRFQDERGCLFRLEIPDIFGRRDELLQTLRRRLIHLGAVIVQVPVEPERREFRWGNNEDSGCTLL